VPERERRERLIWMDLEMTGLDPREDTILQAAVIVTELDQLEPLETIELPIWQPESALERMTPFVRTMHEQNGLLERVRKSRTSTLDAERAILELVARWCAPRQGILAGNSIWQDRRFLAAYMPVLEGFLHFRQVDVTSWKVLLRAWQGEKLDYKKEKAHTALEDVKASIAELKFYREKLGIR
jgi:oligoribonuclease